MTERNDLCPCGSGKKYKKCHYLTETKSETIWDKMRSTWLELQVKMIEFHQDRWGEKDKEHALETFYAEDESGPETIEDEEVELLASQWFFSPWAPGITPMDSLADHPTLVRHYLDANKSELSGLEIRILEAMDRQPFSFYQFRSVKHGESITLRDLFLGNDIEVMDWSASQGNPVGEIIYARVLTVGSTSILAGVGPESLHADNIAEIQNMRKWISTKGPLTRETLNLLEADTRVFYFLFRNQKKAPPVLPKVYNSDGDPLEFHRLEWKLNGTLDEAVDGLYSLTLNNRENALWNAKRDSNGDLKWVEFTWVKKDNKIHKGMDSTLLGRLELVPGKMTAEVNSQKRATQLKAQVKKRLGQGATFERGIIENYDAKMREMMQKGVDINKPKNPADAADMEKALIQMQKKHWDAWTDEPIPALGGLSARRAVKTKEGRELVEALLFSFEAANQGATRPSLIVPVDMLRKKLKL